MESVGCLSSRAQVLDFLASEKSKAGQQDVIGRARQVASLVFLRGGIGVASGGADVSVTYLCLEAPADMRRGHAGISCLPCMDLRVIEQESEGFPSLRRWGRERVPLRIAIADGLPTKGLALPIPRQLGSHVFECIRPFVEIERHGSGGAFFVQAQSVKRVARQQDFDARAKDIERGSFAVIPLRGSRVGFVTARIHVSSVPGDFDRPLVSVA